MPESKPCTAATHKAPNRPLHLRGFFLFVMPSQVGSRDRSLSKFASRMLVQDAGAEVGQCLTPGVFFMYCSYVQPGPWSDMSHL